MAASKKLHGPTAPFEGNKEAFVEDIRQVRKMREWPWGWGWGVGECKEGRGNG